MKNPLVLGRVVAWFQTLEAISGNQAIQGLSFCEQFLNEGAIYEGKRNEEDLKCFRAKKLPQ